MRRLKRIALGVLVLGAGLSVVYGWALLNLDTSQVARYIVWLDSDVDDWQRFPSRTVAAGRDPVELVPPGAPDAGVAAVSVDGRPLAAFLEANETTAFLVARGETLIYELYPNGSSREAIQTSFSVAKSFASTLVGIAAHEGRLTLDDSIATYIPELLDRDPRYRAVTIRHLVTMSSGIRYQEFKIPWSDDVTTYYAPDLRAAALRADIERPPGEEFHYNNFNPLLVGMVLERATGMSVAEYLATRLWQPMGAEADGSWSLDSERSGFEKMESGINGRAVDFLKLGLVFAHEGRIAGRQVVPPGWVSEATRLDTTTDPAAGYQYFWWIFPDRDAFSAIGNKGQFIYVDPVADVTIVRMGRDYGSLDYLRWIDLFSTVAAAASTGTRLDLGAAEVDVLEDAIAA
jgi:CubicO group peptidase (beta-lactamase class C family)